MSYQSPPVERNRDTLLASLALIGLAIFAYWYFPSIEGSSDVNRYREIALSVQQVALGQELHLRSEYPPFATALFAIIHWAGRSLSFASAWVTFGSFVLLATLLYTRLRLPLEAQWKFPAALVLSVFLLGPEVIFSRFDYLIALALYLALASWSHSRFGASGLFVSLAASLKLAPVALIPIMLLACPPPRRSRFVVGAISGGAAALLLPLLVLGWDLVPENLVYMLQYHGERGIEVGSIWSTVDMMINNLQSRVSPITVHHLAFHNMALGSGVRASSSGALVLGSALLWAWVWRRGRLGLQHPLHYYIFAQLGWILFAAPVLSPQFLVWLVPLLIVWLFDRVGDASGLDRHTILFIGITTLLGLLTQWNFPIHFDQFLRQESLSLTLGINVRNLLLFALVVTSLRAVVREDQPPPGVRRRSSSEPQTPNPSRHMQEATAQQHETWEQGQSSSGAGHSGSSATGSSSLPRT